MNPFSPAATSDQSQERRVFERFETRFPAKIQYTRSDFGERAFLRNTSAQGVQFITRDQLFINDSVSLEIKLPDSEAPLLVRGRVIWSKKEDASIWDVGLRFHTISLMQIARLYRLATMPVH